MKTLIVGDNYIELPEVTTAQKNAITARKSMVVYDTDLDEPQIYIGSWVSLLGGGGGGTPSLAAVTGVGNESAGVVIINISLNVKNAGGFSAIMKADDLTADRTAQFQDGDGTVAYLSDIPTIPSIPTAPAGFTKNITSGEETGFSDTRFVGTTFSIVHKYNGVPADNKVLEDGIDYIINPSTGAITLTFFSGVVDGDALNILLLY